MDDGFPLLKGVVHKPNGQTTRVVAREQIPSRFAAVGQSSYEGVQPLVLDDLWFDAGQGDVVADPNRRSNCGRRGDFLLRDFRVKLGRGVRREDLFQDSLSKFFRQRRDVDESDGGDVHFGDRESLPLYGSDRLNAHRCEDRGRHRIEGMRDEIAGNV